MIQRITAVECSVSAAMPSPARASGTGPARSKALSATTAATTRPAAPARAADQRRPAIPTRTTASGVRASSAGTGLTGPAGLPASDAGHRPRAEDRRRAHARCASARTSCGTRPSRSKAVTLAMVVSAMA